MCNCRFTSFRLPLRPLPLPPLPPSPPPPLSSSPPRKLPHRRSNMLNSPRTDGRMDGRRADACTDVHAREPRSNAALKVFHFPFTPHSFLPSFLPSSPIDRLTEYEPTPMATNLLQKAISVKRTTFLCTCIGKDGVSMEPAVAVAHERKGRPRPRPVVSHFPGTLRVKAGQMAGQAAVQITSAFTVHFKTYFRHERKFERTQRLFAFRPHDAPRRPPRRPHTLICHLLSPQNFSREHQLPIL